MLFAVVHNCLIDADMFLKNHVILLMFSSGLSTITWSDCEAIPSCRLMFSVYVNILVYFCVHLFSISADLLLSM